MKSERNQVEPQRLPKVEDLKVSALSPDSEVRIRKLIRLFLSAYGRSFPIASVYREAFWKSHICDRFVSLVARDGNDLIAHLAVYPDPKYRRNVQISLPVLRPDCAEIVREVGELAKEQILSLQKRQNWEMLYYFDITSVPGFRVFGEEVLGTKLTAICPNYLPETGFRARGVRLSHLQRPKDGKRTDILLTTKIFSNSLSNDHARAIVHLPKEHLAICSELYKPLGLERIEASQVKRESRSGLPKVELLSTQSFKQTGVRHVFVSPSHLESLSELKKLFSDQYPVSLAFLDLSDPETPNACHELESHGFRFCGLLPLYQGVDRIIYFRSDTTPRDLGRSSIAAPCSKTTLMYRYIMNYTSSPSQNSELLNAHLANSEKATKPSTEILMTRQAPAEPLEENAA